MTGFVKKYCKIISIIIAVSILISGIPLFANAIKLNQVGAVDNDNENRKQRNLDFIPKMREIQTIDPMKNGGK